MKSSQEFVLLKRSGTTESALPRLLFLNDHVDFVGGGERMLLRVAAIAQRHARIDLGLLWGRGRCVLPQKDQDYFTQIATFAFPERVRLRTSLAHWTATRHLRGWIKERRPQALLAFSFPTAVRSAVLAAYLRLPFVWMFQQSFPLFSPPYDKSKQWLIFLILKLAQAHIVCISQEGMSTFHRLGVPCNRLHLIRNGIDYGWFSAAAMTEMQKSAWRRAHRVPLADLIAVCVARVDPLKNHGLLLQAVQYASSMGVQVVLVCVGEEIPGREAYRQGLQQMAERLGVADRVIWAGYQDDVRDWIAMADVAVLASRKEGVSLALTEAGAIGLPLMGSAVGGIPEIVRHGQTGLLFNVVDARSCAAAFVEFARNPEIRRTMGTAAQCLVRTEFNSTAWDEQWSRLLAGLAAGSSLESTL